MMKADTREEATRIIKGAVEMERQGHTPDILGRWSL